MLRMLEAKGVGTVGTQKCGGRLRNIGIFQSRKKSEPSRLQKDAVGRFSKQPGAVCQNSSNTALQPMSMQKFCCNGIITVAVKQVITTLAGEYCFAAACLYEARPPVFA